MIFPTVVKQSEGLKKIPNPKDFALEDAVKGVFNSSITRFRDFVEEGYYAGEYDNKYDRRDDGSRVLDYARRIIEHPETDTTLIKSRQEVLQTFMAHQNLVNLILNKTIKRSSGGGDDWSWKFDKRQERGEEYLAYVTELARELPESQNPELEAFRNHVNNLVTEGERIKGLKIALGNIKKGGKIKLEATFVPRSNPWEKGKVEYAQRGGTKAEEIFSSGEKVNDIIWRDRWSRVGDCGIPYKSLFAEAIRNVKKKRKKNLVTKEIPCDLEVIVDEERETVNGKATYKKFKLWKTLKSFKKHYDDVVVDIEFKPEEINSGKFRRTSRYLKSKKYSDFLEGFGSDIKEFGNAVVELRYLATAADYFNKLREKGIQITMPTIVEAEDRKMSARNLVEPNLVRKINLGDIVANDVSADASGNLYVITGPNNNGKTTYMNSLGIAQAMGQAGMMVLAKDATISPRDNIFTHYIRPGDLVVGESRYAHELSRIKEIVKRATGNSLILMDEPCSGTSPEDAKQEADAVVRTAGELGATTYVATHFHNLIDTAKELPYGGNLYCVAKVEGTDYELVYTYKIREGSSNKSNGMYLARKMGADKNGLRAILTERAEKEGLQLR